MAKVAIIDSIKIEILDIDIGHGFHCIQKIQTYSNGVNVQEAFCTEADISEMKNDITRPLPAIRVILVNRLFIETNRQLVFASKQWENALTTAICANPFTTLEGEDSAQFIPLIIDMSNHSLKYLDGRRVPQGISVDGILDYRLTDEKIRLADFISSIKNRDDVKFNEGKEIYIGSADDSEDLTLTTRFSVHFSDEVFAALGIDDCTLTMAICTKVLDYLGIQDYLRPKCEDGYWD